MTEDASRDLTAVENVLRDLIEEILSAKLGDSWLELSGVTEQRLGKWKERHLEEAKRREGAVVTNRLIYYSDLTDIPVILQKHWNEFSAVLGDRKTMEVYLRRLIDFRIGLMHGRSLLPFERSLMAGMAGEIRNRVTLWKAVGRTEKEYFARIEQVQDSFGNIVHGGESIGTDLVIHPGDEVQFQLAGWDPKGGTITWEILVGPGARSDQPRVHGDVAVWRVTPSHISDPTYVHFYVTGSTDYHRKGDWDDNATFVYRVLPTA